jgi:Asp/Glu/hydantoin racemase
MADKARIALIHATPVAVEPIAQAFRDLWPEAETVNILDDGLSVDRASANELTPALSRRIMALAEYGLSTGACGILFTCSAFGPAIEAVRDAFAIPVLKPNEAMFEEALQHGDRIGMVATFGPAIASMEQEFADEAARLRPTARLTTRLAEGAMDALRSGDSDIHNRLVAEAVAALPSCDATMLAHFSTSRAGPASRAATDRPVMSSPDSAVRKLCRLIEGGGALDNHTDKRM